MREILFRGKALKTNKWVYGSCNLENTLASISGCAVIPKTIGQYTGIKDKNGTKIFENDIISAHPDELFPDDEIRLVVEWHDYGWFGKDSKGRYTSLESKWVSDLFEVIGNRFDNPELLED